MIELNVLNDNAIDMDVIEDEPVSLLVNMPTGGTIIGGLTEEVKQALLDCFEHVAWVDEHGQEYYDALYDALYPPANLVSISAVYTQSGTVYETDSLESLRDDLVVTAHYNDSSTETVTTYTLSGTLTAGTSTITVLYGGKTTTFNVTVTQLQMLWKSGYTIDTNSGIRIQNNNAYRDRTIISQNAGEHCIPYVVAVDGSTDSPYYPIYIDNSKNSVTITTINDVDFEVVVCYYNEGNSKWTRANSATTYTSGSTVSLASYKGSNNYLVILILKSGATSENTTITFG